MFIFNLNSLKYSVAVFIHFYKRQKLFFIIKKILYNNPVRLFRKIPYMISIPLSNTRIKCTGNSPLLGHHFHCAEQESSLDPVKQVISNRGI